MIVGIAPVMQKKNVEKILYTVDGNNPPVQRIVPNISPYLVAGENIVIDKRSKPLSELPVMDFGNMPNDGGNLLLNGAEVEKFGLTEEQRRKFIHPVYGSAEYIRGITRFCLWIPEALKDEAYAIPALKARFDKVEAMRLNSQRMTTTKLAAKSWQFGETRQTGNENLIIIPRVSSEERPWLPVGYLPKGNIITDRNFALYDAPLWAMALIASRLHWV